jgi:hypothetical protein
VWVALNFGPVVHSNNESVIKQTKEMDLKRGRKKIRKKVGRTEKEIKNEFISHALCFTRFSDVRSK